jgi:hypothetical protein
MYRPLLSRRLSLGITQAEFLRSQSEWPDLARYGRTMRTKNADQKLMLSYGYKMSWKRSCDIMQQTGLVPVYICTIGVAYVIQCTLRRSQKLGIVDCRLLTHPLVQYCLPADEPYVAVRRELYLPNEG